jgi:septum formation protein
LNLLADAGIPAEVVVSGVDESTVDSKDPAELCLTLARWKAETVAERLEESLDDGSGLLVIGCDSVLAFDGQVYGKPRDAAEATVRWRAMRGRTGVLHTGHCLIYLPAAPGPEGDDEDAAAGSEEDHEDGGAASIEEIRTESVARTAVRFAEVTDREIEAYVATGEPLRVAGAFTLDGRSSPFVESIEGDPSNVIGLSMPLMRRLLAGIGLGVTDFWEPANQ